MEQASLVTAVQAGGLSQVQLCHPLSSTPHTAIQCSAHVFIGPSLVSPAKEDKGWRIWLQDYQCSTHFKVSIRVTAAAKERSLNLKDGLSLSVCDGEPRVKDA